MNDQPRPVWLTREQRDLVAQAWKDVFSARPANAVDDVIAAWDAAPADATEAVNEAMYLAGYLSERGRGLLTSAVLRALGHPS